MKLLRFNSQDILFTLSLFLLLFIPLYPKIPLFSPIEQYIVRVRLEDFLILGINIYWLYLVFRRKVSISKTMLGLMSLYILVGSVSLFSAIYILGSIPQQKLHIAKSTLHLLRYIEYFSLFSVAYTALKTTRQLKLLLVSLSGLVIVLSLYGIGQRYARFPVYSTMNREYSKGIQLMLDSPYARVQSTFAGHYDFGAFLVLVIPILLALAWLAPTRWVKSLAWVSFSFGLWSILASASRSSFVGLFGSLGLVIFLISLKEKQLIQKGISLVKKGLVTYGLFGVMILLFGGNLTQLFITTVEGVPVLQNVYQTMVKLVPQMDKIDNAVVPQYTNPVPANQEPEDSNDPTQNPPDVYVEVPEKIEIVTINEAGVRQVTYEERPRTFSQCAQEKGLSLCIRLEALWPQAIQGFKKNFLLGSGYATLNKQSLFHFPEADGTDNNYLRVLGETGLLGFVTFFGAIGYSLFVTGKEIKKLLFQTKSVSTQQTWMLILLIGYVAGTMGLMVNAIYIDVFVASKVALTFWAMTGFLFAIINLTQKNKL